MAIHKYHICKFALSAVKLAHSVCQDGGEQCGLLFPTVKELTEGKKDQLFKLDTGLIVYRKSQ